MRAEGALVGSVFFGGLGLTVVVVLVVLTVDLVWTAVVIVGMDLGFVGFGLDGLGLVGFGTDALGTGSISVICIVAMDSSAKY